MQAGGHGFEPRHLHQIGFEYTASLGPVGPLLFDNSVAVRVASQEFLFLVEINLCMSPREKGYCYSAHFWISPLARRASEGRGAEMGGSWQTPFQQGEPGA